MEDISAEIDRLVSAKLPTAYGVFDIIAYTSPFDDFPHVVLSNIHDPVESINVRIHSECMTGDVFASRKCDCGEQLDFSLNYIAKNGGLLIYLRQEGRGIGLVNKLKAYNLQEKGYNTIESNEMLGFHSDPRDYSDAVKILKSLGVRRINLLTNNPEKIDSLDQAGIEIIDRIPVEIAPSSENEEYLKVKKLRMGHMLNNLDI